MKKKCPKCGSIAESKFCTTCGCDLSGADIVKICPNCGAETTSKFCIQCGTRIDQEETAKSEQNAKKEEIKKQEEEKKALARQREEEEKRLAKLKEEEEKKALARQKEEEEKRLAKLKEEEEKKALARQKEEEEKRLAKIREEEQKKALARQKEEEARQEQLRNKLREKKKYDEALSYMEHADQTDNKLVAAELYRRAESLFEQVLGWEDAESNSLLCARKAKACEIAVESERIAEGKKAENRPADIQESKTVVKEQKPDNSGPAKVEAKAPEGKSKSKGLIVALIIGVLVIGGIVFAMTQGKTTGSQSETSDNSSEVSSDSEAGEVYAGDLIPVDEACEIKWPEGTAILTNYQLEKSENDGDCVNLYFDYSKSGGEDDSFNGAVDVSVFQNGYELDEKTYLTTDAEDNSFNEIKEGATINVAKGFMLNDASELTVVLTAHDEDYNPITKRTQLTIPEDKAKDITGNEKYFEDTGENPIKDGIIIKDKSGELKLTGYKWIEYEGEEMLALYFDYTNLSEEENSMGGSGFDVKVFQNGIEQESSGWSTSETESHYFSLIQKGVTIHCGYSYGIKEKSDIEVKFTCYSDDGEITEEQVVKIK